MRFKTLLGSAVLLMSSVASAAGPVAPQKATPASPQDRAKARKVLAELDIGMASGVARPGLNDEMHAALKTVVRKETTDASVDVRAVGEELAPVQLEEARPRAKPTAVVLPVMERKGPMSVDLSVAPPTGRLSSSAIEKVVSSHRAEMKACYEAALTLKPELSGEVLIRYTIAPTGIVSAVEMGKSGLNDPEVEGCLVRKVKAWKFPAPEGGGSVEGRLPWLFTSGNPTAL